MAVKIKLKRLGKIREPYYRIVVADARTKRDGRAIEEIGKYHPKAEPSLIEVNSERVQHWLSVGAQPTDPVRVLLKITGDWQRFTGEPGTEGTLRTAEPRVDKKERFTAAAKESQASKDEKAAKESKSGTRAAKPARDGAGSAGESGTKPARARSAPQAHKATEADAAAPPAVTAHADAAPAAVTADADAAPAAVTVDADAAAAAPAGTEAEAPASQAAPVGVDAAGDRGDQAGSAEGEPAVGEAGSGA